MVIYLNKTRRAETRLYSLIQPSTHLKSLSMDSIDSKEPKGYLLFQKELLEVFKRLSNKPLTEREAFFAMFIKVNYKDEILEIKEQKVLCKRGESVLSKVSWAKVFNWNLNKVKYFFKKLEELQLIAIVPHRNLFHIRLLYYPQWNKPAGISAEQDDAQFQEFWDKYHETTQMRKTNVARAKREWALLTPQEKELAVEEIDTYFYYLTDTRYCKQAVNYLKDKTFLDED